MKKRHVLIAEITIALALGSTLALAETKSHVLFTTPGAQLQLRYLLVKTMNLASSPEPIEIPARTYAPVRLVLTAKKGDQTWQMTNQGPWGDLKRIKVLAGATTPIKCGGPFKIVPKTSISRGVGAVDVDFAILGQGGEQYSKVITKNGQRASAPGVKILDERGKVLASGQFAYG
jgi:hypothetical protein